MPLPDLIEIVPLDKPVRAEITVPGSKSITNRALILAALADGVTKLKGALWSEDTQVMVAALKKLGFELKTDRDPNEFCNRTITVKGMGGIIPKSGSPRKPLELHVGNAGTAARFLAALVCLGKGVYKLRGVSRMHERPQAALFEAIRKPRFYEQLLSPFFPSLQKLGYRVESTNGKLPMIIYGDGPKPGKCRVSIEESSQFASALLLCAAAGGWQVEVTGENAEESPYVAMTKNLVKIFPKRGGAYRIEPDASSGSYFWAAGWLFPSSEDSPSGISVYDLALFLKGSIVRSKFFSVRVLGWPDSNLQIDQDFPALLPKPPQFKGTISRATDLGDSIMTAIVLTPLASGPCTFTDLGRLRLQETERVFALRTELQKCGADVEEDVKSDTLTVFPSADKLHGAEIETYNDHRMAMCFAILGLKVPGIKIKNPACVKKTFPNFFQKLAASPPLGLGATILDAKTGRRLGVEELFAD